MPWLALHRQDDGRLLSIGTVPPVDAPDGTTVVEVAEPPSGTVMWDEATRAMVPRPQSVIVDRLQDLIDDPELVAVWQRLTAAQRTALRNRLVRLLGPMRFRDAGEVIDLG